MKNYFDLFDDFSFYLENEKCGNSYNSCIRDPKSDESSSTSSIVGGIFGLLAWIGIIIGVHFCRLHWRKQAEKRFIRQVQTAIAQNQQERVVHFIVDTPLIHEQPPPAYE
jgi:hypothetical protein